MARPFFENSFSRNDFPLVNRRNTKHRLLAKSKIQDFSTESEPFSLILGQVAVLVCTSSPESLSSNGQLQCSFRAWVGLDFAISKTSDPCEYRWNWGSMSSEKWPMRYSYSIKSLRTSFFVFFGFQRTVLWVFIIFQPQSNKKNVFEKNVSISERFLLVLHT